MNVLSLFDGMSCAQIALEKAGLKVDNYYACEIDKWAIQITQKNYPNTIQLGDIKNVKASDLPKIDLVIGGSPCQGFSIAGKRLNFDDERSKLFFEFLRLLKECKPKYFLLENVRMRNEWSEKISDLLGVEPITINSSLVSGQNRIRLYWTNLPNVKQPKDKKIVTKRNGITVHAWSKSARKNGSFDERIRLDGKAQSLTCSINGSTAINFFPDKPMDFKPRKVWDRKELLYHDIKKEWRITPIEAERLQNVPDNYTQGVSNTQRYKMLGNGFTVDVIAHILSFLPREF